jgi:uncharacterized membrane protein YphA (DoxX/SURF4 family)
MEDIKMELEAIAWLILRIVYAWLFLYPIKGLLEDWQGARSLAAMAIPIYPQLFSIVMAVVMFFGALSILLGVYTEVSGIILCLYCLLGARVHYKLARELKKHQLSNDACEEDRKNLLDAINLGVVGHVTSAQKNFVLAAVSLLFAFVGSGPYSITDNFIFINLLNNQ